MNNAFHNAQSLTEIILNEGLESIGYEDFYYCKNLKSIEIPATVTTIEEYAFQGAKIKSLKIPETVTSLGDRIVQECNKLEFLELNTNSTASALLNNCPALKTLVIGEKVTDIAKITYSASDFPNLSSVEFKNPKGWNVSGVGPISEADLKDPATAAAKVKQYCDKAWTRSDS